MSVSITHLAPRFSVHRVVIQDVEKRVRRAAHPIAQSKYYCIPVVVSSGRRESDAPSRSSHHGVILGAASASPVRKQIGQQNRDVSSRVRTLVIPPKLCKCGVIGRAGACRARGRGGEGHLDVRCQRGHDRRLVRSDGVATTRSSSIARAGGFLQPHRWLRRSFCRCRALRVCPGSSARRHDASPPRVPCS